jgi:short-subunit dehydrogenase
MKNPFRRKALRASFGTVLITGASRGIGRALALAMAPFCERLILTARSEADLKAVASQIKGPSVHILVHALTGFESGVALAKKLRKFKGVDTVILNAGVSQNLPFLSATQETLSHEFNVNYFSALGLTQTLLPRLLKSAEPTLVGVSSLTAGVPFPGNANYSASKAALLAWLRTLAVEHSAEGLRTCAVLPGYTDTGIVPEGGSILPAMSPESVAESTVEGLRARKSLILPGWINQLGFRFERTAPVSFDWLVARLAPLVVPGWGSESGDRE